MSIRGDLSPRRMRVTVDTATPAFFAKALAVRFCSARKVSMVMRENLPYGKLQVNDLLPIGYGDLLIGGHNLGMFGPAMKSARKAVDLTLEKASEAIGISTSQLSRYESEEKVPKLDELFRAAEVYGVALSALIGGNEAAVPVVGFVRGGPDEISYADGQGPFDMVDPPPGASTTTVAVIVRGGSMAGRADEGDLVYFDRRERAPTDDMIGRLCVVGLMDGRVVVKKLHRSNGSWLLISTSADPLIVDSVAWAAPVAWIKPK
mgnify:CR=1 FL=1